MTERKPWTQEVQYKYNYYLRKINYWYSLYHNNLGK